MASHSFDTCPRCGKKIPQGAKACHHCGWSSVAPTPIQVVQPSPPVQPQQPAQVIQHQVSVTKDATSVAGDTLSRTASSAVGTCSGITMFLVAFFILLPIAFCVGCSVLANIGGAAATQAASSSASESKIVPPGNPEAAVAAAKRSVPAQVFISTDMQSVSNVQLGRLMLRSFSYTQGDGLLSLMVDMDFTYSTPVSGEVSPAIRAYYLDESGNLINSELIESTFSSVRPGSVHRGSHTAVFSDRDLKHLAVIALADESTY